MGEGWERRFRAPTISAVTWADARPERLGVVSNEGGRSDAWAWDLGTGERRVVSTTGVGAEEVHLLPDGSGVVWWADAVGSERGRWLVSPWDGGPPGPLLPDLPLGWMMGLSLTSHLVAIGLSTDEDYRIAVGEPGGASQIVYRSRGPAGVGREWPQGGGGLSVDGSVLCLRHAEHGDILHPTLRAIDVGTGETLGEQEDPGAWIAPVAWSPRPGDRRLAFVHERHGIERPAIWDVDADAATDLVVDGLVGPVEALAWYPDATAILVRHEVDGRHRLLRAPVGGTSPPEPVAELDGTVSAAAFRPDGALWLRIGSSERPPEVRDLSGEPVLTLPVDPPPPGRPMRRLSFPNRHGQTIHGFLIEPDGSPPHPTIVSVHGGPEWHHTDDHDPDALAYADAGFAVLQVNYRGSTGSGRAHREAILGNIGFPESEDVIAALDHAVGLGLVDPVRVYLEGWSWGGYLAMLNAGINPDRWRAIAAGIPTGDYVAAHS